MAHTLFPMCVYRPGESGLATDEDHLKVLLAAGWSDKPTQLPVEPPSAGHLPAPDEPPSAEQLPADRPSHKPAPKKKE